MLFLQNIQNRLWNNVLYKFSLIFCSLYVILFFENIKVEKILFYLCLSLLASVGIAGLGYAFNDIKDYPKDIISRKQNLFINFSRVQSTCLILLFIALAIFPWFYLPFDKNSCYLLLLELILFFIYAFPPFRLKEKGVSGLIADALYAQVVPCFLAVYTFSRLGIPVNIPYNYLILYLAWLSFMGTRNILNHQIEDYGNDLQSNTNTFVTVNGIEKSKKAALLYLIPAEFILFLLLTFFLPGTQHILFYTYLVYAVLYFFRKKTEWTIHKSDSLLLNKEFYNFLNKNILNEFYEIHLALILLFYFSYYNHFYIVILLFHTLLFYPIYSRFIKGFINKNLTGKLIS
ncbi:MAG: hypothetical protein JWN78_2131 [Bacteroidota bacterium]|nr:hypothetical protein [Bacteroidota bacterium]